MYLPDEVLLEHWVSRERLTRYRAAPGSTPELYLWNAELAAAYFEIIGHAEVLLRNVIHALLSPGSPLGRWYDDTAEYPFTSQAIREVQRAIKRATKNGKRAESPGKVVAELSFGFWRFLLSKRHQTTIWPRIGPGFAGVQAHERNRYELEQAAKRVNDLRNRVAHHEPILHYSPGQHLEDVFLIARYVDGRAENMLRDRSRVLKVFQHRPST